MTGPTGSRQVDHASPSHDRQDQQRAPRSTSSRWRIPIEYLHAHKNCVVNQREVGGPTPTRSRRPSSTSCARTPDVVLIGEMRDLETIEAALVTAETGHLVFATLHTNSARRPSTGSSTLSRSNEQSQIRAQLFIRAGGGPHPVALVPKADGQGRVPGARGHGAPTPAIRNLIREDKVHQIYSQDADRPGQVRHADHEPEPWASLLPAPAESPWRRRWPTALEPD